MQWEDTEMLNVYMYEVKDIPKIKLETLEKRFPELSTKKKSVPSFKRCI